ncbi:MAG: hypothetical protein K2X87_07550 [Gemmataceae bacterium]|nr:hypothetical protein [Gemmataceae bacterium]
MTCDAVRTQVLQLPDPRRVPDALRAHLAGCPGCAVWAAEAGRLEGLLERLPVPPAPAGRKAVLVDDLAAAGPIIRRVPAVYRPSGRSPLRAVLTGPVLVYAGGLAAAVLVAVGGWLAFRGGGDGGTAMAGPRHPLLEKVVQRNLALAKTTKPNEKLDILGGLADDLAGEARDIGRVADAGELAELSAWYRTAADGVVQQAGKVADAPGLRADEKAVALAAAGKKLKAAGDDLERIAGESPPHAQPILREIVGAARKGEDDVQKIADGRGGK